MKKFVSILLLSVFTVSFAIGSIAPSAEARSDKECTYTCIDEVWYICCYYSYKGSLYKDCYWGSICRL